MLVVYKNHTGKKIDINCLCSKVRKTEVRFEADVAQMRPGHVCK